MLRHNPILLLLIACCYILTLISSQTLTLNDLFDQKELEVTRIADAMKAAYEDSLCGNVNCECSYSACESVLASKTCAETFGGCDGSGSKRNLDFSNSVIRFANSKSDQSVLESNCWTKAGERSFITNYGATLEQPDKTLKWQYFGTPDGFYRIFPGVPQETCSTYDTRLRPWYVAATSGPKDIVLVLDVSGSMSNNQRIELMKTAVDTVLTTLTLGDFVAIVTFDTTARQICDGSTIACNRLSQATSQVIEKLKEEVNNLVPLDLTNFEAGIETAFDLLQSSPESTASCHRAILFLTDGDVTAGSSGSTLLSKIETRQQQLETAVGSRATMFTYSLGVGAAEVEPKAMACESNGVWSSVSDGSDLRSQMAHFYEYYSSLRDPSSTPTPVWVEPYEDATGAGEMTTASIAVYDNHFNPPRLIGVAGVDLLISDITAIEPNYEDLLRVLTLRSNQCPTLTLESCELKQLRERDYGSLSTSNTVDRLCVGDSSLSCPTQTAICNSTGQPGSHQSLTSSSSYCSPFRTSFKDESCTDCESSTSSGVIAGAVIGALIAIIIITIIVCQCKDKSGSNTFQTQTPQVPMSTPAQAASAPPQYNPSWNGETGNV